jgi:hypothetical protein
VSNVIKFLLALIVALALVAAAIALSNSRPGPATNSVPFNAPTQAGASTPPTAKAPVTAAPRIAPPVAPVAATVTVATTTPEAPKDEPPPASTENPQLSLKTAIPDLVRIFKSGDLKRLVETYMPPDEREALLAIVGPTGNQAIVQQTLQESDPNAAGNPALQALQEGMKEMSSMLELIGNASPALSADGNTATYKVNDPTDPDQSAEITFVKINGLWYLGD